MAGVYDGETTFGDLKKHGDFGLGTFNALDGEMVALDGRFYQVKTDGRVYPVDDAMRTPTATVIFFRPQQTVQLTEPKNCRDLERYLDARLPTRNIFYAVKITGAFKYIKARSVPRQSPPYPPLAEAAKKQAVFEFHQVSGTLVGFRTPEYLAPVNVPGYHFHFLTADKQAGGHVLDCITDQVAIEIAYAPHFYLTLPGSRAFYDADLTKDKKTELQQVEK